MIESEYRPREQLDLRRTLGAERRGPRDPTILIDGDRIWRATGTPTGPATLALRQDATGTVLITAWGPGAPDACAQVPALCGAQDSLEGFDAILHPVIAEAHRRNPGLRLSRTDAVFDALAGAILEQKVTGMQAFAAWRWLIQRHGEPAPGPTPRPMFLPPTPSGWAGIPSWAWHRAGVEPPQSRAIVSAAARADSLNRALHKADPGPARERILTSLPGIGPWTAAETCIRAFGDPDAVSVGDYHLAHVVGFALTGSRTDDAGMLQLLRPWAGHRQRVIRLIRLSGAHEPRRGPRMHIEDHRSR